MIDITFEINGRKVNPNNFKNAIESEILSSIKDTITKSVGSIYCREHNQKPKIIVKGRNLENLSFQVSGCCDTLIKEVEQKLK